MFFRINTRSKLGNDKAIDAYPTINYERLACTSARNPRIGKKFLKANLHALIL
jgi:hypothetical protein